MLFVVFPPIIIHRTSSPTLQAAAFQTAFPLLARRQQGRRILIPHQTRADFRRTLLSSASSSSNVVKPDDDNNANVEQKQKQKQRDLKYQQLHNASRLSLAPMMEYTDRHFRHIVRLISNRTLLYTEMVAANAIVHERKDRIEEYHDENNNNNIAAAAATDDDVEAAKQNYRANYLLRFLAQGQVEPYEGPSVLQLGGSAPDQLFQAAQCVMELTDRQLLSNNGYTALNLNCGCPSPKVAGKGCFGAALMDEPKLVAELTQAMHDGCQGRLPVTVKCRIGTDTHVPFSKVQPSSSSPNLDNDEAEYRRLCEFIETVAGQGVVTDFQIHARIAVLKKSFSPADNRKVPPLKYNVIRRLIHDYPDLTFTLNGGINSLSQAQEQFEDLPGLHGIMIGRAWAADPWSFAMADPLLYQQDAPTVQNRLQVLEAYGRHADYEEEIGDPVRIRRFITKAVSPLFHGETNSKRFRIALDEIGGIPKKLQRQGKSLAGQPKISELILAAATEHLSDDVLLRTPQESYERMLFEEEKSRTHQGDPTRSAAVSEWQAQRKAEEATVSINEQQVAAG